MLIHSETLSILEESANAIKSVYIPSLPNLLRITSRYLKNVLSSGTLFRSRRKLVAGNINGGWLAKLSNMSANKKLKMLMKSDSQYCFCIP